MPRAAQSSAISHWLLSEYLESPLLALTLIQRRQPSLVSSARAACSMRSRSALRRASRSASVSGLRLKRRAIAGSLLGPGPPRWRADPLPPARPPGRATIGRRVGPPAGGARLRGLVELVRQLVADRLLVLDALLLGALLLASGGLGLVVGGVGALDGLLEPAQRRRDVRAGELLECLGREVLVRAPAGGGQPLAGGEHQARGVLLGDDDDERAAVELARCLGAVDEPPHPGERGPRVALLAVVIAQPSAGAVLARL